MGCVNAKQDITDEMRCQSSWDGKKYNEINKFFIRNLAELGVVATDDLLAIIVSAITNNNYRRRAPDFAKYKDNFAKIRTAFLAIVDDNTYWARCFDKLSKIAIVSPPRSHRRLITFTEF